MKEILTKNRRHTDEKTIKLDANRSELSQKTMLQKANDPGRVKLPVIIENVLVGKIHIGLGNEADKNDIGAVR